MEKKYVENIYIRSILDFISFHKDIIEKIDIIYEGIMNITTNIYNIYNIIIHNDILIKACENIDIGKVRFISKNRSKINPNFQDNYNMDKLKLVQLES